MGRRTSLDMSFLETRAKGIASLLKLKKDVDKKKSINKWTENEPLLKKMVLKELSRFNKTFEEKVDDIEVEDGGQANIIVLSENDEEENGIYVRIVSWDETKMHKEFKKLKGKKLRITIEEI
jgi:hypothetical protein